MLDLATLTGFLNDHCAHELHVDLPGRHGLLLKSAFDEDVDFLYYIESFRRRGVFLSHDAVSEQDANPHAVGQDAVYAGIYSHVRHQYFDPPWPLSEKLPGEFKHLTDLQEEFQNDVYHRVLALIHDEPVPVTEDAEPLSPCSSREDFEKCELPTLGLDCFLGNTQLLELLSPESFKIRLSDCPTAELAQVLSHYDQAVQDRAQAFIRKRANWINDRLCKIGKIREEVSRLESTPGSHHIRRAILRAVAGKDLKTVVLEILKEGQRMTVRINALVFHVSCSSYPTWYMDAKSKKEFEQRFGRSAVLNPEDILKVTHGKRVLYDRSQEVSQCPAEA